MRTRMLTMVAALLVLMPAAAWAQCQVLDDFTSGPVRLILRLPNSSTRHVETGTMIGGARLNAFRLGSNQFLQAGELDADVSGGPYVLTMGVREFFRVDLAYGVTAAGTLKLLGYHPAGCDRFRVSFNAASQVLNFNVEPFQAPGFTPFLNGINLNPVSAAGNPFCADFLFTHFVTNAPGITQDFAGKGIDFIDFIFQSGSANGANAFALTRIETTDLATATANPCMFVAP